MLLHQRPAQKSVFQLRNHDNGTGVATLQRMFLAKCLELTGTHFSAWREARASSETETEREAVKVLTEMSLPGAFSYGRCRYIWPRGWA
jgi:hypothetical protein